MTKKDFEFTIDTMYKGIHSLVEGVNSKLVELQTFLNKAIENLPKELPAKNCCKKASESVVKKTAKVSVKTKTVKKPTVKVKETVTITTNKPKKLSKKTVKA